MAVTDGAPAPRGRRIKSARASRQTQLPRQPSPVFRRHDAIREQRCERGEDLSPTSVDAAVTQLRNHAGETVLVLVRLQLSILPPVAQTAELFRDPSGR